MDKELIQNAVTTFSIVPEVYEQAIEQMGGKFPEGLVDAIKADPKEAENFVMSDKDQKILGAIVSIYQQNKDYIDKAASDAVNGASMFRNGGKFDYLKKLQPGGSISRRQMYEEAEKKGMTRAQARLAYQNQLRALRSQGFSGAEMRQAARRNILGQPKAQLAQVNLANEPRLVIDDGDVTWEAPEIDMSSIDAALNTVPVVRRTMARRNSNSDIRNATQAQSLAPEERIITTNTPKSTKSSGGFTIVSSGPGVSSTQTENVDTANGNIAITSLPEEERAAHDAYIASLNRSTQNRTVDPRYVKAANDIYYNGTSNVYWQNPRPGTYVMRNPEKYVRTPDGRWISPDQRYVDGITYGPVLVRRQGGSLAKENEINKKYIKDSEKAGAKASKEMSDLKAKHKAKLKKVRKGQNGYSIDHPGKETIISNPISIELSTLPSSDYQHRDSVFLYGYPGVTAIKTGVSYDKKGNPHYFKYDLYDNSVMTRVNNDKHKLEYEGVKNKWETLKKFFIDNPEFNLRPSYKTYKTYKKLEY